jgi:hypothetical protein
VRKWDDISRKHLVKVMMGKGMMKLTQKNQQKIEIKRLSGNLINIQKG